MRNIFLCLFCVGAALAFPQAEQEVSAQPSRPFEYYFLNALSNIGLVRITPRQCSTSSELLPFGQCTTSDDCTGKGGAAAGTCERAGVCCVYPVVCGSRSEEKLTWFVNKNFPNAQTSTQREFCELTVKKYDENVRQLRIDFDKLVMAGGTKASGRCDSDWVRIVRKFGAKEVELAPTLCGDNSGQHVYIDMPKEINEVKVQFKMADRTKAGRSMVNPQWRVSINQLLEGETAPSTCLQYYDNKQEVIRSLNFDNPTGMEYDICLKSVVEIETEENAKLAEGSPKKFCRGSMTETDISHQLIKTRVTRSTIENPKVQRIEMFSSSSKEGVNKQIEKVVSQLKDLSRSSGLNTMLEEANIEPEKQTGSKKDKTVVRSHSEGQDVPLKNEIEKQGSEPATGDQAETGTNIEQTGEAETSLVDVANDQSKGEEEKPMKLVVTAVQHTDTAPTQDDTKLMMSDATDAVADTDAAGAVDTQNPLHNTIEELVNSKDCGGSYLIAQGSKKQAYICGTPIGSFRDSAVRPEISKEFEGVEKISVRATDNPLTTLRFSLDYEVHCHTAVPKPTQQETEPTQGGRFNLWQFLTSRPFATGVANQNN